MEKISVQKRFNYREDFRLIVRFPEGERLPSRFPDYDITLTFYIAGFRQSSRYTASVIGGVRTSCRETDRGELMVIFNRHNLGVGRLMCDVRAKLPDSRSDDGKQDVPFSFDTGVELVEGAGDLPTPAEVEAMVPYAVIDAYDMAAKEGFAGTRADFMAGLNALPALAAMATDVTAGKAAVADALTRAGAPTAHDAPLSEMARAVASLPVSRDIPETLITDLPALVAANTRADWPYVAAILTYSDTVTLDGADAYMASGLPFTTEQGGEHTFPEDGQLHYVLFYFRNENYTVPYTSVIYRQTGDSGVRAIYCHGGHPAYGVVDATGVFLQAAEAPGAAPSGDAQTLKGGSWYVVASTKTQHDSGTWLDTISNLRTLYLPRFETLNGGTIVSTCPTFRTLRFPALTVVNGGTLVSSCANLTTLTLPALAEMNGGTLVSSCDKLTTLSLPSLSEMNGGRIATGRESIVKVHMGAITNLEKVHCLFELNMPKEFHAPELRRFYCISQYGGLFRENHYKDNLVCNAYFPKCEYFHGQWQDNSDRSSALIEFGSRIEHISIWSGRTWTDFKITIGEGAVCDIQIGALSTLTESSLHDFAAKLGDNTANPTKAIQVGAANVAKLSDEEKAILVAKNYSLS